LTRRQLDVALAVAEEESILGLPDWPAPLVEDGPPGGSSSGSGGGNEAGWGGESSGFSRRRVECLCGAHRAAVAVAAERLALLKGRVSADPSDPEVVALERRLALLGPAPRRALQSAEAAAAALARAAAAVSRLRDGASSSGGGSGGGLRGLEPVLTEGTTVRQGTGSCVRSPRFGGRCK
jgi:hypothetical protein